MNRRDVIFRDHFKALLK